MKPLTETIREAYENASLFSMGRREFNEMMRPYEEGTTGIPPINKGCEECGAIRSPQHSHMCINGHDTKHKSIKVDKSMIWNLRELSKDAHTETES